MDGIIVINKSKGCTSHDVVNKVKRIFKTKVGHTGTLDPNATGVLPILVGQGTKLSYYLIEHDKEYICTLKLGQKRDTADSEGSVIEEREVTENCLKEDNVNNILRTFLGVQSQIPPMYSAIKVKGKKLYEYARKGESIEIKPRTIEIYNIELISINKEEKEIRFKVKCSKGTYIRSLCEDIAEKLETVGYMKELERTVVGKINVEELEKNRENEEFIKEHFITIEDFFESQNKAKIILDNKRLEHFLNGVKLTYNLDDGLYRIYNEENKFIGIGNVTDKMLKREIVL